MCYKLVLLNAAGMQLYSYNFDTTAGSFVFRDAQNDAAFAATCSLQSPPPPAPPLVSGVACPGAAGEYARYLRISWRGGLSACATQGYLHVAEVQVWVGGRNIAQWKPATISDLYLGSSAFRGQHMTDGKLQTMAHSASNNASALATVDLQVGSGAA